MSTWTDLVSYEEAVKMCSTNPARDNGREWLDGMSEQELRAKRDQSWLANDRQGYIVANSVLAHRADLRPVKVLSVYDVVHYVTRASYKSGNILLVCCHKDGSKFSEAYSLERYGYSQPRLHRDNIKTVLEG